MANKHLQQNRESGITLLITLLLMGVLLGISTALMNLTLKQYQLSGIALSSETAFQAANAGLECILFHDFPLGGGESPFAVPSDGSEQGTPASIACMGVGPEGNVNGTAGSAEEQLFEFTWGSSPGSQVCSSVSIYKFSSDSSDVDVIVNGTNYRESGPCPQGSVCTVVQARGYNVPCNEIATSPRVVEREYTQVY